MEHVIGIVGGMGSYATLDFFRRILEAFPAQKEWERPRVIIDNYCTMPSRVRAIIYNERYQEVVKDLSISIANLISSGATDIVLACNTSHCFLKDIYRNSPEYREKIIDIIDGCSYEIKEAGCKKVFLLATEGTIQSKIYDNYFERQGIDIDTPLEEEQKQIRRYIEAVKANNISDRILEDFITYVNGVENENVIIGCTELPILYQKVYEHINKRVFDPLQSAINELKKRIN